MQQRQPIIADLVLIGGGHAHVHVLKQLGMMMRQRRLSGLAVTLITNAVRTPYSGMLPGYVAGHYTFDDIHLDLQQICRWANIRLIHAAAERITYDHHPQHQESSATFRNDGGGGGGFVYCHDGRPPIRFDCLSIDVGCTPAQGDQILHVVPVKPISKFSTYYQQLIQNHTTEAATTTTTTAAAPPPTTTTTHSSNYQNNTKTIAVVGGGAGGLELLLSIQYKLQHLNDNDINSNNYIQFILVTKSAQLLPQHNSRVRRIFERVLRERKIIVYTQTHVQDVILDEVTQRKRLIVHRQRRNHHIDVPPILPKDDKHVDNDDSDDVIWCDDCLWCVSAGSPAWLAEQTPFATTPDGFVRVHDTWECIHHPGVFAAGDCCHMDKHPRPKAGVFAVRAGPPLLENILNYLYKKPLVSYRPQRDFLGLISAGDQYAVATKGNWLALGGKWVWKWKDWIDRTWMAKYQQLPDMEKMMAKMSVNPRETRRINEQAKRLARSKGSGVLEAFVADPMRCGGCGAKVGSTTVSRVLRAIHDRQLSRALRMGLEPPPPLDHDDAAVHLLPRVTNNSATPALIQTIDYFREMVADPFVFGKIVAVHALSDIYAMGATAQTALSLAVAPFAADESITESTLLHLLSGVNDVLQDDGVRMIGGHTCEGQELACGLSIQGFTDEPERLLRKRGGKIGDKIVLTKPIGTGALFAADMRGQCKGEHVVEAIHSMIKSNITAGQAAMKFDVGVRACTDVTGFGLIGHLLEMLMANEDSNGALDSIGAVMSIQDIPFLRGGLEASRVHIYSTLQPQNARNRRAVVNHPEAARAYPVEYPLLFDPQTAGGLMFFVDPSRCGAFVKHLLDEGISATVIGELEEFPTKNAIGLLPTPFASARPHTESSVCTIGSGGAVTGQRVRVAL